MTVLFFMQKSAYERRISDWSSDVCSSDLGRHVDEGMPVARAGFKQQHAHAGIFGQEVGEHAAGGAGADDDVVVVRARRVTRFGHLATVGSGTRAYARRGGAQTGLWDTVCAPHGAETG